MKKYLFDCHMSLYDKLRSVFNSDFLKSVLVGQWSSKPWLSKKYTDNFHKFYALFLIFLSLAGSISCQTEEALSEVFMPKFFANHMVLQRDQPIRIWGDGRVGQRVVVKLNDQEVKTTVGDDSNWVVEFESMPASGPHTLDVNGKTIQDVQIGDVWVAGGQSNMEWVMSAQVEGSEREIDDSDYPLIRFFKIPHDYDAKTKADVRGGEWKKADSDNLLNFSAIAWFFAKQLHLEQGVAVGIIESNWGGTHAEGWLDASKVAQLSAYSEVANDHIEREAYWTKEVTDNKIRELTRNDLVSKPQNGEVQGVVNPDYDAAAWETVNLPKDNPFSDIAWFRKKFTVRKVDNFRLNLGELNDMAYVYLNGGRLMFKDYGQETKEFIIPAGMVKEGENVLAVRLLNTWNNQALLGKAGNMSLKSSSENISLEGEWKYSNQIEEALPKVEAYQNRPGMMYNAMIAPIIKYPIKGVIWYQGESNTNKHEVYRELFGSLIEDWRAKWNIGDFPFLFVQLANFMEQKEVQPESQWAYLREAQAQTRELPNTGMAVTIDIGNATDIHPRNKRDVGHRLWRQAQKIAYGKEVLADGPQLERVDRDGNTTLLIFSNEGEGLKLNSGNVVEGFVVADSNGDFSKVTGKIVGTNQVQLTLSSQKSVQEIRYGWADNPKVNLYNSEDLPAEPFRFKM